LPEEVFDFHSHIYNVKNLPGKLTKKGIFKKFPVYGAKEELKYNRLLFPGKKIHFLFAGFPYSGCNIESQNEFVWREAKEVEGAKFLIITAPWLKNRYLEEWVEKKGAAGFKPYKCFSKKDPENSRITDFLPYKQVEIASRYELVITLHLSKKGGLSDRHNFNDLLLLSDRYPSVRWNLAHCGRIFIPQYIEDISYGLKEFKGRNIYFDISAVCDSDVFSVLLSEIGSSQILYSSDNPVGLLRGKCVGLGYDWVFITEDKIPFDKMKESFGSVKPTFILYEQLISFKRACIRAALKKKELKDIFFNNARKLLGEKIRMEIWTS